MKNCIKNILGSAFIASSLLFNGCYKNVDVSNKTEYINKNHLKKIVAESGFIIKPGIYKHDKNFDELYNYFSQVYVPAYNECMVKSENRVDDFSRCEFNETLNDFIEIDERINEFDLFGDADANTKYFKEHGAIYRSAASIFDSQTANFITGDIILEGFNIYYDEGLFKPYKLVIYNENAESLDSLIGMDVFSFWGYTTKTAYLDIDSVVRWAHQIEDIAQEKKPNFLHYNNIYAILSAEAIRNKTSYEEEFIRAIIETTIKHHEPAHDFFEKWDNGSMNRYEIEEIVDEMECDNSPEKYKDLACYIF